MLSLVSQMRGFLLTVLVWGSCCRAFTTTSLSLRGLGHSIQKTGVRLNNNAQPEQDSSSSSSSSVTNDQERQQEEDSSWLQWATDSGLTLSAKVSVRPPVPEQRGKGGVVAKESISALEVLLRVPRTMMLSDFDMPKRATAAAAQATNFSWATDLTAATLLALHSDDGDGEVDEDTNNNRGAQQKRRREWIASWKEGGWGTDSADLGPPDVQWGAKSVTGSLLATGSDNDHNVYAKFRFPCHPVLFRAGKGLALLTGAKESDAREALQCRGRNYRSMRDALSTLVKTPLAERSSGSQRERRAWDVADVLSRVLSRATILQLEELLDSDDNDNEEEERIRCQNSHCIVPLHERLAHSVTENTKLISSPGDGREILLVATRTIAAGEELTRDYTSAPTLEDDTSEGALSLLLQFGLPPSAWPPATGSSTENH